MADKAGELRYLVVAWNEKINKKLAKYCEVLSSG